MFTYNLKHHPVAPPHGPKFHLPYFPDSYSANIFTTFWTARGSVGRKMGRLQYSPHRVSP